MSPAEQSFAVQTLVQTSSSFATSYVIALAAVGVLAMAGLEVLKTVLLLREHFHGHMLQRWLHEQIALKPKGDLPSMSNGAPNGDETESDQRRDTGPVLMQIGTTHVVFEGLRRLFGRPTSKSEAVNKVAFDAWCELVSATTSVPLQKVRTDQGKVSRVVLIGLESPLVSLDLPRMMGQIQDVADSVLTHPNRYETLLAALESSERNTNANEWQSWSSAMNVTEMSESARQRMADQYAQANQFVRRRLDALQLQIELAWRRLNHIAALVIGFLILYFFLGQYSTPEAEASADWSLLAQASLGGILAPLAKDLLVGLRRVRGDA